MLYREVQARALPAAKMEGIKSRMKQYKAAGTIAAPAVRLVPAPAPAPSSSARSLYLLRSIFCCIAAKHLTPIFTRAHCSEQV